MRIDYFIFGRIPHSTDVRKFHPRMASRLKK